tara:strand:- start:3808 stop:3939 length:132 start_codon:yes stop_codon:yes gene_type:complete
MTRIISLKEMFSSIPQLNFEANRRSFILEIFNEKIEMKGSIEG